MDFGILDFAGGMLAASRGMTLGSDRESKEPRKKPAQPTRNEKERDMGAALRSVYQKTVNEAIPDEMLDLLGKLG
jgi:hypothetical protein